MEQEIEAAMSGMFGHPGPGKWGGRGPRGTRPWNGVVEDTPCLWVAWLKQIAKLRGVKLEDLRLEIDGKRLQITSIPLTFGDRHYFRCPRCYRRCEAIYFLGQYVGCRICLRLGYRSQCHEPGTPWAWIDDLLSDRLRGRQGRHEGSEIAAAPWFQDALEVALRAKAERWIQGILKAVQITGS